MNVEIIKTEILAKVTAHEGKQSLDCAVALSIAKKLSVTPAEVGRQCNEMKIKIKNCQLGCF
jgi:hypothetical protein